MRSAGFWVERRDPNGTQSQLGPYVYICRTHSYIVLLLLLGGIVQKRPIHCDHLWDIMLLHLSSNHSWFILQSSLE
jgi:hypothetical protein